MDETLLEGLTLFNAGMYFEAHEVWEHLWRRTEGGPRLFYQGLIQAAVGLHHLQNGNRAGARGQLQKALAKLELHSADYLRIDNGQLVEQIRRVLDSLEPGTVRISSLG